MMSISGSFLKEVGLGENTEMEGYEQQYLLLELLEQKVERRHGRR